MGESGVWRSNHPGRMPGQPRAGELLPDPRGFHPRSPSGQFQLRDDFGAGSPDDSDALDYAAILRTLWRRKYLFLGIAVLLTGLATAIIVQLPPRYIAHALVVVGDPSETNRASRDAVPIPPPDTGAVQTAVEILHSPQLAAAVIRDLGLDSNPEFNPAAAGPDEAGFMARIRRMVSQIRAWLPGAQSVEEPDGPTASISRTIRGFLSHLQVSVRNNSRMIDVAFESRDAELAMRVANALVDHYIDRQLELRAESAKRTSDWLRQRIVQLETRVAEAERAVEEFRSRHGLFSMPGGSPLLLKQMTDVTAELATAETERAAIEARLRQYRASIDAASRSRLTADVVDSPLMEALQAEEAKVQQQLAEMSAEFGDKYPPTVGLREKLRNIHAAMRRESQRVITSIENDLHVARMKEDDLRKRLNALKEDVARMNNADVTLRALERAAEADRRILDDFMARLTTTSQNADTSWQKPDVQIASYAQLPVVPDRPRKGLLILVSGIGALTAAGLVIYLIERSDRSIRSLKELETQLRIAGLGMLPISESARLSPAQAARYGSAYREALKAAYATLFSTNDAPRVTVITSALPGEGKTTLALGLAALAAQCGNRVLLLDADFWKKGTSEALGIRTGAGLAEVLENSASPGEVIISDVVSGADIMLPGRFSRGSLLAWTRRLSELLVSLRDRYDLVIVDAPPVLSASEAVLLAQHADATVMAVRWGSTPRDAIATTAKKLRRAGAFLAGSVITMVNERQHASYGYTEGTYFSAEFECYQSAPTGAITWSSGAQEASTPARDEGKRTVSATSRHALLVIDVPDTAGAPTGHARIKAAGKRLIETINDLSYLAARSGVMVLYAQRESGRGRHLPQPQGNASDAQDNTPGSRISLRRASQHVFLKHTPDAFSSTRLNSFLRENGIEHLFIVGMDGVTSIRQTAQSALERGYLVTFIQDGVLTSSEAKWRQILQRFETLAAFAITKEEFEDFCQRLRRPVHA